MTGIESVIADGIRLADDVAKLERENQRLRSENRFGDEAIVSLVRRSKILCDALDALSQNAESESDRRIAYQALVDAGKVRDPERTS